MPVIKKDDDLFSNMVFKLNLGIGNNYRYLTHNKHCKLQTIIVV